jgi:hypothetical protein
MIHKNGKSFQFSVPDPNIIAAGLCAGFFNSLRNTTIASDQIFTGKTTCPIFGQVIYKTRVENLMFKLLVN